jgi:hypothetical protein
VLLAATTPGAVVGSSFNDTSWTAPAAITGATTTDDLAVAVIPATGDAVGVAHAAGNQLATTVWNGTTWTALAQLNADGTQGAPTIAAVGGTAHLVYWGINFDYYEETFASGAWTTQSVAVQPAGSSGAICGPSTGVLAVSGAGVAFAFVNGTCNGTVNHLYESDLSAAGAWQATQDVANNPTFAATQRPALAAPGGGVDLVVAFVEQGAMQIFTAARTSGTWSIPAALTNGLTNDPMAMAPLAGGGAVLAYRGTDLKLYTSTFGSSGWSIPTAPLSPNPTINAVPAVAKGIGGASAELAYVDGSGFLWHTRLLPGTPPAWSTPTEIDKSTAYAHVAIASGP